jgi:hypothetical protein
MPRNLRHDTPRLFPALRLIAEAGEVTAHVVRAVARRGYLSSYPILSCNTRLVGSLIAQANAFGFEEFVVRVATSRFSEARHRQSRDRVDHVCSHPASDRRETPAASRRNRSSGIWGREVRGMFYNCNTLFQFSTGWKQIVSVSVEPIVNSRSNSCHWFTTTEVLHV